MTTEQLRKEITVTDWEIHQHGMRIQYNRKEVKILWLTPPDKCAQLLSAIGSIDSGETETFLLNYENSQLHWLALVNTFILSQWEALTLVIRHELEKETEKEISNGDIGKAIDSITK